MPTIQEILGKTKFTKNDLLDKCRELGIRGYSGLKKQELILKIELFVIDSPIESDIELTPEEQEIDNILNEFLVSEELPEEQPEEQSKTRDVGTQVKPDDFKKEEPDATIHYQIISKVELEKTKKPKELLLKTINASDSFKLGDIILNDVGVITHNNGKEVKNTCFDIICKDGDKKKLINFDSITMDTFLQEQSYLKNINYDNVIMDMDSKFKVDEFSSPIIELCIFYAKLNENPHMLETIYEFTDPPYPVLSNNEVLHNPYYFY